MKADFSSLNNKVNSHAVSIKQLECQMSQHSAQLEPKLFGRCANYDMENSKADHDKCLAVLTRSGKVAGGDVKMNDGPNTSGEEEDIVNVERSDQAPKNSIPKEEEENPRQSTTEELLKKRNEDEKFKKFLSMFKTLSINLPLVEALLEMSGYAKFMKELVTKKKSMDFETIEVSHNCSTIMSSDVIKKKEVPGAFTILCTIGMLQSAKALCDLGVSINLMSYAIFKQLGLGEPKSTTMRLLMADRSSKYPIGILYDILVKVDKFIFPLILLFLDCEIDAEVPIILGKPFLATERALVDVESGELKFRVNDEEATFNVCKSMKQPSDIHMISTIDVIDEAMASE
ncbi:uncharacterized protein [Solanum tuberosum]|uniref:uncharacterized protein n=1 Tax=Solanum tuberosum TaxID=4113 RepID=UPI00073A075A|nr:PREDICTED: uncharacterized protein LOC107063302 [Solanum tuberosum]